MRAADRQRAAARRTHQHGETDEQYAERVRKDLEQVTGLTVAISTAGREECRREGCPLGMFAVRGYTVRGLDLKEPLIRVVRHDLASAAKAFEEAAEKLRGGGRLKL